MYKVSSQIIRNATILMQHTCPTKYCVARFSRSPASYLWYRRHTERDTCPPPPPPPLPPFRINYFLVGTGVALAITAGFMVFAKTDPEVRDWLTLHMPWFDDLIAIVYEENKTIGESALEFIDYFKECVNQYMAEPPEECVTGVPPAPVPVAATPPIEDDDGDDDDDDDDDDEDEDEDEICVLPPMPVVTTDICQLERCIKEIAEMTINNYNTARDYCIYYNDLVEATMTKFTRKGLLFLQSQKDERDEVVAKHVELAQESMIRFSDLANHVSCGCNADKARLDVTRQIAQDFIVLITRSKMEYEEQYRRSISFDAQWKMVECLMNKYWFETSALYPELNYESEEPRIETNADLLIVYAKKYIDLLNEEWKERLAFLNGRIVRAYDEFPVAPGQEAEKDEKIQKAVKQATADMEKTFNDRMEALKQELEDEERNRKQEHNDKYEADISGRLIQKEKDLTEEANLMIKQKVDEERQLLQIQVNEMALELTAVEIKLEDRLKAERETKRAQQMYAASISLLAKTRKGDPLVKIDKELEILRKAAVNDKLVTTVLNAIPSHAKEKGIVPESVVRVGYHRMENVALKVAMVDAEGGILPIYAMSWLQSKFLFFKPSNIPQVELDNPPKEPFKDLDTFDLLQRARYFMATGNLAAALRYVDAMEGASRGAAETWYQSANALLQTRQAAEAIIAHAAALNLQYL